MGGKAFKTMGRERFQKKEREGGSARVVVVLVKLGAIARADRQLCAAEEYCHQKSIVNGSAVHILVLAGDGSVRRSSMHAYLTALKSKHAFGKLRETCNTIKMKV